MKKILILIILCTSCKSNKVQREIFVVTKDSLFVVEYNKNGDVLKKFAGKLK